MKLARCCKNLNLFRSYLSWSTRLWICKSTKALPTTAYFDLSTTKHALPATIMPGEEEDEALLGSDGTMHGGPAHFESEYYEGDASTNPPVVVQPKPRKHSHEGKAARRRSSWFVRERSDTGEGWAVNSAGVPTMNRSTSLGVFRGVFVPACESRHHFYIDSLLFCFFACPWMDSSHTGATTANPAPRVVDCSTHPTFRQHISIAYVYIYIYIWGVFFLNNMKVYKYSIVMVSLPSLSGCFKMRCCTLLARRWLPNAAIMRTREAISIYYLHSNPYLKCEVV